MRSGVLPKYIPKVHRENRQHGWSGFGLRVEETVTPAYPERLEGFTNSEEGFHGYRDGWFRIYVLVENGIFKMRLKKFGKERALRQEEGWSGWWMV